MATEASQLARKLQFKAGMSILVLNAPAGFDKLLVPLPDGASLATSGAGPFDVVHCFAQTSAELTQYAPAALAALRPGGMLWFAYPKGSSGVRTDLSRDSGWDIVTDRGWEGVRQVAIDTVWSALRFRPNAQRGSDALLDKHFAGVRAPLRAVYERVLAIVSELGDDVTTGARDTYVAFGRPKHFAVCKTRARPVQVDLGLRLPDAATTPRLAPASKSFGSESATHVVALVAVDDVDAEVEAWLKAAYADAG